jgi:hypothetical protein
MRTQTRATWACEEFRHAPIGDGRWGRRLIEMGGQAARSPAGRITECFRNDAERQGAYGLLESKAVTPEQVAAGVYIACARRCAELPFVYCAVDGTSLTLTDRRREKDFGSIGTHTEGARGIKVINAMVLSPEGVPLGLSAQQWWTRSTAPRPKHRHDLPPEGKETGHWLDAMRQTRKVMSRWAPETRCWFQLDREGDAWPMLTEAALENHWFTVRSSHNRRVRRPGGRRAKLRSLLARQPVATTYELEVKAGPHRKARTAHMVIRACTMTLDIRDKRTGRRFPTTANVVQAREQGTTPSGEKPIQWILLTNHPIDSTQDLLGIVFGYSMRWRIEELHRTWKNGACRVEDTQLRSAEAVIKWAIILVAVAVRIERIKQLSREQPQRPAADEFSPLELRAITLLRFGKSAEIRVPDRAALTIAEVTLWVAKIGGYTGKSSGGPPGSATLARGLKEVATVAQALEALGLQK